MLDHALRSCSVTHITALSSDTTTTAACTSSIPFSFHSYLKTILLLHYLRLPTWARSILPQRQRLRQASTTAQRAIRYRYTAATMGSITPAEAEAEAVIANGSIERPLGPPAIQKVNGWQLFEKMGRPKFVVAVSWSIIPIDKLPYMLTHCFYPAHGRSE